MKATYRKKLLFRAWMGLPLAVGVILAGTRGAFCEERIPSLDQLLSLAAENHPDVVTAKARVALAEAKLNAARLEAVRQVIALRSDYDSRKRVVEVAKLQFTKSEADSKRARALAATAAIDVPAVEAAELQAGKARQELIDAQAGLARAEVELRQLVERMMAAPAKGGKSAARAAAR